MSVFRGPVHAANRPSNATAANGVTWINWGPYLDGRVSWRLFLKSPPPIQQIAAAMASGHAAPSIAPYRPQFCYTTRAGFEAGEWPGCNRPH
jgi:hypothetical protein